nr:hypothetical protein [Haloechinothrix alba]
MRATAKNLLGPDSDHVQEVFGGDHGPSPWRWSSARPDGEGWFEPYPAARIAIDEATHTARDDMLAFAEQTAADRATFTVTQFGHIDGDTMRRHELVLAISGQATRSIGALRRRGLGWVSIRCTDRHLDEDAVDEFMELISR